MRKLKISPTLLTTTLILGLAYGGAAVRLSGQDRPGRKRAATDQAMSESQSRGEGLFLQRCSLCHLPRIYKFGSPPVVGPSLVGVFKTASPDQEKFLKQFIERGTPDMPGFRYGLDAKQMEDLVAYLKTL
jgi:mono/diheme cytochrome c family protein